MENYCRARQATYDNMTHVPCLLLTFGICGTNLFSTAIMIPQTCLSVTLYGHYLSCYGLLYSTRLVLIARSFLGLCDEKRSYKHVSDFGRLWSYDHLKLRIEGNDY